MLHTFIQLPLATIFDISGVWIAIIIPVVAMIFAGTMAGLGMYFHHQRQRLWHETARIALEKGQPLPSYVPDKKWNRSRHRESGDFRGGLVLIAVGAGLYLFFTTVGAPEARFVGAIPGFIGIALLLHGLVTALLPKKASPPEDRSPQT